MVYRNSWLAGLAALAFAFVQLDDLILPTESGVAWQYLALAALTLGIVISWTALAYRLKAWLVVLINAAAALVAVVRVATPDTTAFFMPTVESMRQLGTHLQAAQRLIRTGVEPVAPDAGVVVVVMLVLWAAGIALSWGLLRGHPYVALLPPLVLSLQFATMDRRPTSTVTIAAFVALVALVIFAITSDDRDHTSGRMAARGQWASTRNRPGPAAAGLLGITILGSVLAVGALEDAIPRDGVLSWRVGGGLPADVYGGSLSYNPFIGIRQSLVSGSDTRAFIANIASDVPADQVYFRFMTLEEYDGEKFSVGSTDLIDLDADVWENPGHSFAGPTAPLATVVAIDQLDMAWLPTPATPFALEGVSDNFDRYLTVRPDDAAVYFPNRTTRGMTYRVDANIPQPDLDVLATDQRTGELSVSFRTAIGEGAVPADRAPRPAVAALIRPAPPDAQRFLQLPSDPAARISEIRALARQQTVGLETPFEMGLALETYLRAFEYTTDITPGHGAQDLAAWLLDPDSPNYHRGYCENFATALAVMARSLGIHSRVVLGFTPGERNYLVDNQVVVRDRNAHAWTELWMPSQGWVRFDATPRPDPINPSTGRLVEDALGADIRGYLEIETPEVAEGGGSPVLPLDELLQPDIFLGQSGADTPPAAGFTVPGWLRWAAALAAALFVVVFGVPALKRWRHRRRLRRLREGDITAAWQDIVLRLGDFGHDVNAASTPREVAAAVDEAMLPLAEVYGLSIYGRPGTTVSPHDLAVAEDALLETRRLLAMRASPARRMLASYRAGRVVAAVRRR